ncbi:zinc ribbon domain-containing protein [Salicibibacter kimchii]|uniref:Transposase n=1 Tax=Salicibibacter kimchii TaxID=2099786 RepID=A0A345BVI1_9BACI|nr:zinc ribbon domain-containing protein [Salicibibacter kimchii]AXF54962.1 transposase [Salicibibacter kimchii]
MAIQTTLVQRKNPSKSKQKQWLYEQQAFVSTANDCVERINNGEKLSSKNVDADLKAAIKNEAIRLAKKAISDFKEKRAKTIPIFRKSLGVRINFQNWDTVEKNGRWYISFTGNHGKKTLPVVENKDVKTYFPWLTKKHDDYRRTIQLLRKGVTGDDIRKTAKSMKKADRTIHSWAFYQLRQFIKERAIKHNIPVVDINPYKTSQTCFGCGIVEKDNRHRDTFQCKSCGHQAHADLNAANNIATSTSLAV